MTATMADLTDIQKKKLSQVQDLLALAEDEGATPEEAALASARATEILAKYNIDAALAAARDDTREIPMDDTKFFPNPYAKQHMSLYASILHIFGGECIILNRKRNSRSQNTGTYLRVYGFEADLTAVDVLYTSLLLQATNQLAVASLPSWENARSYRVGWWIGFNNEVIPRLKAAYEKAKDSTNQPGTAIVLRDRSLEVKAKLDADYPKRRRVAGSRSTSYAGYSKGVVAGQNANIHDRSNVGGRSATAIH